MINYSMFIESENQIKKKQTLNAKSISDIKLGLTTLFSAGLSVQYFTYFKRNHYSRNTVLSRALFIQMIL